jgi:hypothetical protein
MLLRLLFNRQGLSLGELYSDWLVYLAVVVGRSGFFADGLLALDDPGAGRERIEGPSGAMGNRSILDLNQVDWIRTRRSLDSRLKVGNVIYTIERLRILLSPWFYSPAAFSEFLDRIGYPGN